MTPFFSIVVPCCDVAPYLPECLDSVAGQPFPDWECLLMVETSSDATEDIARGYAARDPRFRVFTGPRTGSCSVARNRGVAEARGVYVVFLDGDDCIAPGSLQRLHDLISARPGADLYPCAIVVFDDKTGRTIELRDNFPPDAPAELTGPEATLLSGVPLWRPLCPMLQMTVFRCAFLTERRLESIPGLRRQDSEFSPRALYQARRVVPLHEQFYLYRIHSASVSGQNPAPYGFLRDWAVIFRSLFAFHAEVSREAGFNPGISSCWGRRWLSQVLVWWFLPQAIDAVPRAERAATLGILFQNGFGDFEKLLPAVSFPQRCAARWIGIFLRRPSLRGLAEWFFRHLYFPATGLKR